MKSIRSIVFLFVFLTATSQSIQSPSSIIRVDFKLDANGTPIYSVKVKNDAVVLESSLGVKLKDREGLEANFEI